MIIKQIPLRAVPNQILVVQPSNQSLTISIYKQGDILYCNVNINAVRIITGAKCLCGVSINQYNTPLIGYLTFWNKNKTNPTYESLGTDSILLWSEEPISDIIYSKYVIDNQKDLEKEFG